MLNMLTLELMHRSKWMYGIEFIHLFLILGLL